MSQIDPIPAPNEVNAAWMSRWLDARVSSVTATAVGTGQVGATFRFGVDFEDATSPTSLIGKFMSDDPVSRATGIAQMSYLREVKFYQRYGHAKPLPIPDKKFAAIDENSHAFVLIMSDFPHHRPGNQLVPAT